MALRLLLLIALILFIIAFVSIAVPVVILGLAPLGWAFLGFIFWVLDLLFGGWAVSPGIRRVP